VIFPLVHETCSTLAGSFACFSSFFTLIQLERTQTNEAHHEGREKFHQKTVFLILFYIFLFFLRGTLLKNQSAASSEQKEKKKSPHPFLLIVVPVDVGKVNSLFVLLLLQPLLHESVVSLIPLQKAREENRIVQVCLNLQRVFKHLGRLGFYDVFDFVVLDGELRG
jgi:hypothetical protein